MDYIREELLRQRSAWDALLRSGRRQEAETSAERDTGAGVPAKIAAENGQGYEWRAAESGVPETIQRGVRQVRQTDSVRRRSGDESAEMDVAGWYGGTDSVSSISVRSGSPLLRPERGQEQGAKELSRVIQRDSRRYDGGFALY